MAGRSAHPWFYATKNSWYVWIGEKKVSLKVRGEANKDEAMKAWHRRMANGRAEEKPQEAKPEALTVAEMVKGYLDDAEGRLKPGTVAVYKALLQPFANLARYGSMKADRFTAKDATNYARGKGWSNSTKHDFLSVLKIAFRWAGKPLEGQEEEAKKPWARMKG